MTIITVTLPDTFDDVMREAWEADAVAQSVVNLDTITDHHRKEFIGGMVYQYLTVVAPNVAIEFMRLNHNCTAESQH